MPATGIPYELNSMGAARQWAVSTNSPLHHGTSTYRAYAG